MVSLSRRRFTRAIAAVGLSSFIELPPGVASGQQSEHPVFKPKRREKGGLEVVGPEEWQLKRPANEIFGVKAREIEGYASSPSIDRTETIRFHVNVRTKSGNGKTADYQIEIFRLGWYGGTGACRVSHPQRFPGLAQQQPVMEKGTGLIECDWVPQLEICPARHPEFRNRWSSWHYVAKLTELVEGKQSYIKFIVRDDSRSPDLLVQSSVTTDQCYNLWGGASTYQSANANAPVAIKVSFRRPYGLIAPDRDTYGLGKSFRWEYNLVRYLEREGHDVAYTTNVDVHRDPLPLFRSATFVSVGHDEYWSAQMRTHVETARDSGVNLAFLGANTCYWQIRFENGRNSTTTTDTIVAWKERSLDEDPYMAEEGNRSQVTGLWRDERLANRPENGLAGVMYYYNPVDGDLVVENPDHWLFAGTGLKRGDVIEGLLGYEVDRVFNNGHTPADLITLCHSGPTGKFAEDHGLPYADMTIYQAASGASVFASGSNQWVWGLDDYGIRPSLVDPRAQRMMKNLLAKFARRTVSLKT